MKGRVVIVGNGTLSDTCLALIKPQDFIIGVDRAAYWLIRQGRVPDIAIGDFDSVTKQEFDLIKKSIKAIKIYPKRKNQTDMELSMRYAAGLSPKEVYIFGATGGRFDHMLATLHLIDKQVLVDEHNRIRRIGRGKTIIKRSSYRYISILPYTKSTTISLNGFKYNVNHKTLNQGTTLGVSNEIQKVQGVIRIFSGKAWVVESND